MVIQVFISRSFLISEKEANRLQIYGAQIKHGKIQRITKDDLVKALDDEATVFSALELLPVKRSFPRQCDLTPAAIRVLNGLCQGRSLPFDCRNKGMELCVKRGWIHVDAVDKEGDFEICRLPSRLHQK